jgi:hypothetical protein
MKALLLALPLFVSSLALADGITVDNQADVVRVDSVSTEIIGQGFPSTKVTVRATFGNPCMVPNSKELVSIVQYSKNYDQLLISLGQISMRICPAVYKPTPATIELGTFTRPNDGLFTKIIVNGVEAKK